MVSLTTSLTSSGTFSISVLFASARTRRITSLARLPSSIIHSTERHAASTSGVPRRSQRRPASVGDDGGERLVHFMGDRGRQFAKGCYARYVCEFHLSIEEALFAGAQPLFRSLAVGHVDDKGNPFVWFPLEKRSGDQNRHASAIFEKVFFFARLEGSSRVQLCEGLVVDIAPFGRRQLRPSQR